MTNTDIAATLNEILHNLKKLQEEHTQLASAVDTISGRANVLASVRRPIENYSAEARRSIDNDARRSPSPSTNGIPSTSQARRVSSASTTSASDSPARRGSLSSKIILTSYPGQSGVDPIPLDWGNGEPTRRGPIVVGRGSSTIKRRNGKLHFVPLEELTNVQLMSNSYWCAWRFIFYLLCTRSCKQKFGTRT